MQDMRDINVAALVGSLRQGSFNRMLLENSLSLAPAQLKISEVPIRHLPLYDGDLEADLPPAVTEFQTAIAGADAVLMVTPEYNFSYSGVLKNALDWGSRRKDGNPFSGKPVAIQSAAAGWAGGLRSQYHLHQVVLYFDMRLVRFPEVVVGAAHTKFDDARKLTDAMQVENIKAQLQKLLEIAQ